MESRTKDGGMPRDYLFAADDLFQLKKKKGKGKGKYNKVTFLMTATLEALRSRQLTLIPRKFSALSAARLFLSIVSRQNSFVFFFALMVNLLLFCFRTVLPRKKFCVFKSINFYPRFSYCHLSLSYYKLCVTLKILALTRTSNLNFRFDNAFVITQRIPNELNAYKNENKTV